MKEDKEKIIFQERYMNTLLYWGMGGSDIDDEKKDEIIKKINDNNFFVTIPINSSEFKDKKNKITWDVLNNKMLSVNREIKKNLKIVENFSLKLNLKQLDFNLNDILKQQEKSLEVLKKITSDDSLGYQGFMETVSIIKALDPNDRNEVSQWYENKYLKRLFLQAPLGVKKWYASFSSIKEADNQYKQYKQMLLKASDMTYDIKSQHDKYFLCKKIYFRIKRKIHQEKSVKIRHDKINAIKNNLNKLIQKDANKNHIEFYYSIACFLDKFYDDDWDGWENCFNELFSHEEKKWWRMLDNNKEMKELYNRGLF